MKFGYFKRSQREKNKQNEEILFLADVAIILNLDLSVICWISLSQNNSHSKVSFCKQHICYGHDGLKIDKNGRYFQLIGFPICSFNYAVDIWQTLYWMISLARIAIVILVQPP